MAGKDYKEIAGTVGGFLASSALGSAVQSAFVDRAMREVSKGKPTEATGDLVREFLKSHGVTKKIKIATDPSRTGSGYDLNTGTILLGTDDTAVALHEAGHALRAYKNPKMTNFMVDVSRLTPLAVAANWALAHTTKAPLLQAIDAASPMVLAASKLPELALEYDASNKALAYVQKNYPEMFDEVKSKLDKAFHTHVAAAAIDPVSFAASNAAGAFMKKAGVGRIVGKTISGAGRVVYDATKSSLEMAADLVSAKGVRGKAKVAWGGLVGPGVSEGGSFAGKALGGTLAATPIYYGVKEISKAPSDPRTWGAQIGGIGGQVLGGHSLLGSVALGAKGESLGRRAGEKLLEFSKRAAMSEEDLGHTLTSTSIAGMGASFIAPKVGGGVLGAVTRGAGRMAGGNALLLGQEALSSTVGKFNRLENMRRTTLVG